MKTVYKFKVIILMLYVTACGGSGGGAASDAKVTQPSTPAIQPGGGTPTTFPLTYYTLVENKTVTQGGQTYHVTDVGHCVVYNSQTYCWDIGWQKILAINYETDFWGLCDDFAGTGQVGMCFGGASHDPVINPTLWTPYFTGGSLNIPTPLHQPSDVFAGISTNVTCSLTGTIVDCVDFQIDTAQVPL